MLRSTRMARTLRARSTGPEDLLWQQLRGGRLDGWKFRRQTPLGGGIADFCCHEASLTIEVDGRHYAEQAAPDAERRRAIEADGFVELRFTNDEVRERLPWVMTEIRRALDLARARTPRAPFPRLD
jgi:very-short-patch-repair endonuclease